MMITLRYIQTAVAIAACMSATGCSPDTITPQSPPETIFPQSSMFTGQSGGCGNFVVYRFNSDKSLATTLRVNEKTIKLTEQPVSLEITSDDCNKIAVEVLQFRAPAISYFCDCVASDSIPVATWAAVSGTVDIESNSGVPPKDSSNATHKVSVVLKNVRLKNSKMDETVELNELEIRNVWVGWSPG